MDIKKRRSREKEEMKHLILNASIKILNKDGFDNLSIRKIADLIGYSPTTIYIYYENQLFLLDNWHNLIASFVDIVIHGISK